jgi:hypothetical protein
VGKIMTKFNRGVVLGITVISLLLIFLIGTVVFYAVTRRYVLYEKESEKIENRIVLKTMGQEIFVLIYESILDEHEVPNMYHLGEIEEDILISKSSTYDFIINYNQMTLSVKISLSGKLMEWVIN